MPQTDRNRSARASTLVETPLSPDRAFVVEFAGGAKTPRADLLSGRVEHVISGQATRFTSAGELLAFVHGVLRTKAPARKPRSVGKPR